MAMYKPAWNPQIRAYAEMRQYLVLPWGHKILPTDLPKSIDWFTEKQVFAERPDCLVYSLTYKRLSRNVLERLQSASIHLYECKDSDEFVSLVVAHQLGTDLSNLWQ